MGLTVRDPGGGDFERVPTGVHSAVCARYYDLGMQPGFEGQPTHKVVMLWEIDERYQAGDYAGNRMRVSKTYTASLSSKANMRKDLESWRGRPFTEQELEGFDLDKILGAQCTLNLTEVTTKAGKKWTTVAAIMPPLKGVETMVPETPADYVPEWVKKILDTQADTVSPEGQMPADDDIPF